MTTPAERRAIFLEEMGVGPLWTRRDAIPPGAAPMSAADAAPVSGPTSPALESAASPVSQAQEPAREASGELFHPSDLSGFPDALSRDRALIARMDWAQLKEAVAGCTRCDLCQSRTKTVFGTGDEKAKWLFVGEGPGRNEDQRGDPFVGPAGKLLDNMLLAMDLRRGENAYIANIVKCRPTDANGRDRPPRADEAATCLPYLERQIALIQPAIIIALGKTAALSLLQLDPDTPVSSLRGKVHRYADLPLVVTYHPAYLLRNLADKRKAWADLCLAMSAHAG